MSKTVTATKCPQNAHSEKYETIRKDAESKWPSWKVATYNSSVAVSKHAQKIVPLGRCTAGFTKIEEEIK